MRLVAPAKPRDAFWLGFYVGLTLSGVTGLGVLAWWAVTT